MADIVTKLLATFDVLNRFEIPCVITCDYLAVSLEANTEFTVTYVR
jgi:hypothetical protein